MPLPEPPSPLIKSALYISSLSRRFVQWTGSRWTGTNKTWLFLLAFILAGSLQANNVGDFPLERIILTGLIDSSGDRGYWEKRKRIPIPGIVITSETYVRFDFTGQVSSNGQPSLEEVTLVGVFDVYRIELAGNISSAEYRELERIALSGIISSYHDEESARRYGLAGTISNSYPELVKRYGLTGIISNADARIELAYLRREDPLPQETPPPGFPGLINDVETTPVVRDGPFFWTSSRDLFAIIEPTLTTYLRRDEIDREGTGREGSTLVVVSPYFKIALQQPRWSLIGHYDLESGKYLSGNDNGFTNHEVVADWSFRLSRENQINVGTVYRNWHDRRTRQAIEDFNAGLVSSFDYDSLGFDIGFRHGGKQDRKRYEISAHTKRTRVDSEATDLFGFDLLENRVKATGYWRVRRRVTLLLDGEYKNFDYRDRDESRQYRVSTGVEFFMPRRIKGSVQVGHANKRHTDLGLNSNNFVWNVDVSWRPWRRTTLEFRTARELLEVFSRAGTILAGEFGIQQYGRLSWSQQWNSTWDSKVSLTYQERDFEGIRREDEATQLIFGTSYRATPRLTLRGDGVYTNRRTLGATDFDRWTLTLRADMGLYRGRR